MPTQQYKMKINLLKISLLKLNILQIFIFLALVLIKEKFLA